MLLLLTPNEILKKTENLTLPLKNPHVNMSSLSEKSSQAQALLLGERFGPLSP